MVIEDFRVLGNEKANSSSALKSEGGTECSRRSLIVKEKSTHRIERELGRMTDKLPSAIATTGALGDDIQVLICVLRRDSKVLPGRKNLLWSWSTTNPHRRLSMWGNPQVAFIKLDLCESFRMCSRVRKGI